MVFRIGSITLSPRPNKEPEEGICTGCFEKAEAGPIDNSFDDQFGIVTDWGWGTSCCECEVADGKIWLDKTTVQTAAKDYGYTNYKGEFVVRIPKGTKYRKRVVKGYYIDPETYEHHGIFKVERHKVA